jgi:hypothetical protein
MALITAENHARSSFLQKQQSIDLDRRRTFKSAGFRIAQPFVCWKARHGGDGLKYVSCEPDLGSGWSRGFASLTGSSKGQPGQSRFD